MGRREQVWFAVLQGREEKISGVILRQLPAPLAVLDRDLVCSVSFLLTKDATCCLDAIASMRSNRFLLFLHTRAAQELQRVS
jgi:hypothetical protein